MKLLYLTFFSRRYLLLFFFFISFPNFTGTQLVGGRGGRSPLHFLENRRKSPTFAKNSLEIGKMYFLCACTG